MVLPTAEMKQATGRNPEAGLLSRVATAAVGSAFSTLTETVKKHEQRMEDVVRETLHPMLKSWVDGHLQRLVEHMVERARVARERGLGSALRSIRLVLERCQAKIALWLAVVTLRATPAP